ncbi:glycosyltransferase family 2 protein [Patescibacteria group bacterium]|nr:glycosyltransferase family 2 protein [Patescibacteria group bacterium]
MNAKPELSVIIPIFNEEGSIAALHEELVRVLGAMKKSYEIIIVNDGSTDRTPEVLSRLKPVTIITLRINSGQSSALNEGLKYAHGKVVITMDGDGQNDPQDIPRLLSKLEEGYDVVCGWRYKRRDPLSKRLVSKGARMVRSILVDDKVQDAGCTLRVYRAECFKDLDLYGEMHRMLPAMLRWRGFKITEIKVNHRSRQSGVSKYGWGRIIRGFLDMLLVWFLRKYNQRPLHLFGTMGLLMMGSGMIILIIEISLGMRKFWLLVGMEVFIAGFLLLVMGILADLIVRNNTKGQSWLVKDVAHH